MRILMVCQHYWPERFQITEICEELASRGHQVTALVGIPNYPDGVVPEDYLDGKNRRQLINGVSIVRCEEVPRRPGIMGLMMKSEPRLIPGNHGPSSVAINRRASPARQRVSGADGLAG